LEGVEWVRPQAYLGFISRHKQLIKVNQDTHSQLTKQGQIFAAILALPETMIEPVLNGDHAVVK
jgi:hypothetical protein